MSKLATFLLICFVFGFANLPVMAADHEMVKFIRVSTQFIAALGDPDANSGNNAQLWGLWEIDPGPRGVCLNQFDRLMTANGKAPANWQFNSDDWWLEEHGLIMESPVFSLPAGKYVVTGDRQVVTVLTIIPADEEGNMRRELDDDATLYDVTHLACRSARYTPETATAACTPAMASQAEFPVSPGAVMPSVPGCNKQDYAVLFIIGKAIE